MLIHSCTPDSLTCPVQAVLVSSQAPLLVRVESLTALLQQAVEQSEQQPHSPLPSLSVTFATTQVQVHSYPFLSIGLRTNHSVRLVGGIQTVL